MKPRPWLSGAVASLLLVCLSLSANAATQVVTSIKPLELLVLAVADDDVEITNLVPSGSSPHTYTMKPSQRRALQSADRVFWVGPQLESFLARLLEGDELQSRTIALAPGEADDDGHNHQEPDHHDHGHDHGVDEGSSARAGSVAGIDAAMRSA